MPRHDFHVKCFAVVKKAKNKLEGFVDDDKFFHAFLQLPIIFVSM